MFEVKKEEKRTTGKKFIELYVQGVGERFWNLETEDTSDQNMWIDPKIR